MQLDGPRLKLARADTQIDLLRDAFSAAMTAREHHFQFDFRRETYRGLPAVTVYVTDLPVLAPEGSVDIGEIVHNLHSALDQLAWSLIPEVKMRGLRERAKRDIAFPMAERRAGSTDMAMRRLPGVDRVT